MRRSARRQHAAGDFLLAVENGLAIMPIVWPRPTLPHLRRPSRLPTLRALLRPSRTTCRFVEICLADRARGGCVQSPLLSGHAEGYALVSDPDAAGRSGRLSRNRKRRSAERSAQITELPFTNVAHASASIGVTVPRLHYYDREAGLLFLEDFGDVTLAEACRHADRGKVGIALYRVAIEELVQFQAKGTTPPEPRCIAFHRRFDVPLLMWEFDHFLEYGIMARLGKPMAPADDAAIREEFQRIAEVLAGQPQVFVHRDYHSRNLMVDGARIGIIDFQDALDGAGHVTIWHLC